MSNMEDLTSQLEKIVETKNCKICASCKNGNVDVDITGNKILVLMVIGEILKTILKDMNWSMQEFERLQELTARGKIK